jgi:hypothetical protein
MFHSDESHHLLSGMRGEISFEGCYQPFVLSRHVLQDFLGLYPGEVAVLLLLPLLCDTILLGA